MRLVVGIGIGIAYLVVGYVTTAVIAALEGEDVGEEIESVGVWLMWPFLILLYVLMKLIPWVGRRVAILPVVMAVWLKERRRAKEVRRIMKGGGNDEVVINSNKGTGKFKG